MEKPNGLTDATKVHPAALEGRSSVLPWEISSRLRATGAGGRRRSLEGGEKSAEAHGSPEDRAKGRIRQPRISLDHLMDVKRQQAGVDQGDLLDEALKAALGHGVDGEGGAGPETPEVSQAATAWDQERALTRHLRRVERCWKPPWYVIRTPGGVKGGRREAPPYSMHDNAGNGLVLGRASGSPRRTDFLPRRLGGAWSGTPDERGHLAQQHFRRVHPHGVAAVLQFDQP